MSLTPSEKETNSVDAYDVFHKVDELVSKPVTGSTQALHWQTFRNAHKTETRSSHSAAPTAPLSKSQRAAGFASWKDEQEHETRLRQQRNEAPLHQGYTTFQETQQPSSALTKKQIKCISNKIRPDDKEYFIPAATFQGSKFDYVFTTRPERGTGYYWDGSDSLKQLHKRLSSKDGAEREEGTEMAKNKRQEVGDTTKGQENKPVRTKKPRIQAPTTVEISNHPLEQINAMLQSRQKELLTLPPGWEQAIDVATKQPYYFNRATGERSWEKPKCVNTLNPTHSSNTAGESDWLSAMDAVTGKTYYYNAAGETRWDDPRMI